MPSGEKEVRGKIIERDPRSRLEGEEREKGTEKGSLVPFRGRRELYPVAPKQKSILPTK